MELSVVIPALNEADNLAKLLPQLRAVLSSLRIEYEIIVVDDDSTMLRRRFARLRAPF